ncbi:hypothetical protein EV383_4454 [Pseudonocardia sediminis]|uniref:Uncharacterized protein n=1 Tax=Pseudonocardia sediminis TaxID=1397368 RepID=A0A4Q7V4J0_PSEST|nr:hypothetical protein [Pseudonocardia sediminis]RZT87529.1 hypothetical protein EV383_4454 [Pseudonocardia sediminis]
MTCPVCWLPSVEDTHPACLLDPAAGERFRPSEGLCINCREFPAPENFKTCTRCFFFPEKFRAAEVELS